MNYIYNYKEFKFQIYIYIFIKLKLKNAYIYKNITYREVILNNYKYHITIV